MKDLDEVQEASAYILLKISADNLLGDNPSKEEMLVYAREFAQEFTKQITTDKDVLVTFEATILKNFVWFDSPEEAEEHRTKDQ